MSLIQDPTARMLWRSFIKLRKTDWQGTSITGYKPSDLRVLNCIQSESTTDDASMKVSEISQHLHVTAPTVTQVVNSLELNGLVKRLFDPDDRRVIRVKLTDAGERALALATKRLSACYEGLVEYLGAEQSTQLVELLTKACSYFHESERIKSLQASEDDTA